MKAIQPAEELEGAAASERLDAWKEIAAYLRRDVRTVQRWHERAGLPVHRHVDPRQRGVFAFRRELDAWANQSRAQTENTLASEDMLAVPTPAGRGSRVMWWLLAVVLLSATAAGVVWTARRSPRPAPLREHIWVIVPALDNQSGDEILGDSLQFVLERGIRISPRVCCSNLRCVKIPNSPSPIPGSPSC